MLSLSGTGNFVNINIAASDTVSSIMVGSSGGIPWAYALY